MAVDGETNIRLASPSLSAGQGEGEEMLTPGHKNAGQGNISLSFIPDQRHIEAYGVPLTGMGHTTEKEEEPD